MEKLARLIVKELKSKGVPCYLYHVSNNGSCYIRFKDARIGSIRIADHASICRFKYKFNIVNYQTRLGWIKDKYWRFFESPDNWEHVVNLIVKQSTTVNGTKRKYVTPKHKLRSIITKN